VLLAKLGSVPSAEATSAAAPADGSDPAASAGLDRERLALLADLMDRQAIHDFMAAFLDNSTDRAERIRSAVADGDLAGAGREAHAICGGAGNIGAVRLERAARGLQATCRDGDAAGATVAAGEVGAAIDATKTALRAWLAQLPLEATAAA
jgi:two-component system, sensor histidine kinase and response regulator